MSDSLRIASRLTAVVAVIAAVVVLVVLVAGGDEEPYEVTAEFENASQLVGGENVVLAGVAVGSVERIELGDEGHALVTFRVDDELAPLPVGTTATVRSTSLASIANRRVELTLPETDGDTDDGDAGEPVAADGAAIPDGGTIGVADTVSAVDLDEVFNTLDPETIRDLKAVIKGLERSGRGVAGSANRGFRFLNPLLSSARRVLAELGTDRSVLEQLIADTSQLSGALAARAPELSELVRNLNAATGAVARQRDALTGAVSDLPAFLRETNTTLVNLRAAADDLEPLIVAARPAAERLGPVFDELRGAAAGAVPTLRDLAASVRSPGRDDDLVELTRLATKLGARAVGEGRPSCGELAGEDYGEAADDDFEQGALGETACVLRNALPVLDHLRAYTPDLVGWFDDFATSGTLDANGGIGRIFGAFTLFSASDSGLPELLSPIDPGDLFGLGGGSPLLDVGNNARCPGANERDPGDGSLPFTDGGTLNCDPEQVPTGP